MLRFFKVSLRRAYPVWRRDMLVALRLLTFDTVTTIMWPLIFYLTFGLGLNRYMNPVEGQNYMLFVVPGLIAMTCAIAAYDDGAWSMWFHRIVQKTINEYRVNPMTPSDIITGKILSGFSQGLFKTIIVSILLLFLSRYPVSMLYLPQALVFVLLGAVTFSCAGSIAGTIMDKPEHLSRIQAVFVMPLIFLGGIFFPITVYPEKYRIFVRMLPTTALFEGFREAITTGSINVFYTSVLIIYSACLFVAAVLVFNKKLS